MAPIRLVLAVVAVAALAAACSDDDGTTEGRQDPAAAAAADGEGVEHDVRELREALELVEAQAPEDIDALDERRAERPLQAIQDEPRPGRLLRL